MISTRQFIPALAIDRNSMSISPLSDAHRQRAELYARYWSYYRGHHRKNIKVKPGQADDNVTINWSKKIVNQGVGFLFGKPVTFEIDENDERTKEEAHLDRVWADDPRTGFVQAVFLKQLAQNGAVTGMPVIRIVPPVGEGELPTLRAVDPSIVDVITDPDDVDIVTEYHVVWQSGDTWKRQRMVRDGEIWIIYDDVYRVGRKWETVEEAAWEFDFAPIMHAQNLILANSQFGISDLEDADLNDAVNFAASNINRILRFHAHPKTIGTGFPAAQLQTTAVDQFWTVPSADARVFNLEMQSDLASSRAYKADLEEGMHQVSDTPRFDPVTVNLGALSGVALRILYGPLLSKTEDKRGTYGGLLARVNRALLIMAGMEDKPVRTIWQSPLPENGIERVELFERIASATGGNLEAAARIAGYNRDQVEMLSQTDYFLEARQ